MGRPFKDIVWVCSTCVKILTIPHMDVSSTVLSHRLIVCNLSTSLTKYDRFPSPSNISPTSSLHRMHRLHLGCLQDSSPVWAVLHTTPRLSSWPPWIPVHEDASLRRLDSWHSQESVILCACTSIGLWWMFSYPLPTISYLTWVLQATRMRRYVAPSIAHPSLWWCEQCFPRDH